MSSTNSIVKRGLIPNTNKSFEISNEAFNKFTLQDVERVISFVKELNSVLDDEAKAFIRGYITGKLDERKIQETHEVKKSA